MKRKKIKIISICVISIIVLTGGIIVAFNKYPVLFNKIYSLIEKIGYAMLAVLGVIFVYALFEPVGGTIGDSFTDDEETDPFEFIRPVGKIPDPCDPKNSFSDFYGHQYYRLGGVWYDENGNFAPDYLKNQYGLNDYEDSQE